MSILNYISKNSILFFLEIQRQSKTTVTNNKKEISEKTKKYFEQGPLKYEKKLYDFAKNIFKERLNSLGIELK